MRKPNFSKIGQCVMDCFEFTVCILGAAITVAAVDKATESIKPATNNTRCIRYGDTGYGDAIEAVMNDEYMSSSNKRRAVEAIKRDEQAEYYRAVISILRDEYMSSNKKILTISSLK